MAKKKTGLDDGSFTIHGVNVLPDAFAKYKTLADLKTEPGKIFDHLPEWQKANAYKELATDLGILEEEAVLPAKTMPAEAKEVVAQEKK